MIEVVGYPRLHFGLTDLSGATARAYGGIGASFEGPAAHVTAEVNENLIVELDVPTEDEELQLRDVISRAKSLGLPVGGRVRVVGRPSSHVGVGSTTATTMAIVKALAVINAWKIGADELIRISGRGRTSAIGVNCFFSGGLVADAGQPRESVSVYMPSITSTVRMPSLHLGAWTIPADWVVTLAFVHTGPTIVPGREARFFLENTPTDRAETLEQLGDVFHGILPAFIEGNIASLAEPLRQFQSKGFKAAEIAAQPAMIQAFLRHLWSHGVAAGLSSLGPTVFAIHHRTDDFHSQAVKHRGIDLVGPFEFRNSGHEVSNIGSLT